MSNAINELTKILIVEDSPTQLEKLKYILEEEGYQITSARDGRQALEILDTFIPTVIISDIMMPEINGYQLCKIVKAEERTWDIPVILMTTLTNREDVYEGLACGADSFITKPYSENYLLNHIEKFLSKKVRQHSDSARVDIEIPIAGKNSSVSVDLNKMLNLLIDTYEAAINKNNELQQSQDELISMNYDLENIVKEKTEELLSNATDRMHALEIDIAERKRIEEILRGNEERYRVLTETSIDGFWVVDLEGRILEVNYAYCIMSGYSKDALLSMRVNDLEGNEPNDQINTHLKTTMIKGRDSFESIHRKADGTFIHVQTNVTFMKDKHVFLCFFNDITDRNKSEENLLYLGYHDQLTGLYNRRYFSEELLRLDVERNLPISIIQGDTNGLKLINDSFGHVFGDELLQKTAKALREGCREDEIIARLGGDEFAILLPNCNEAQAEIVIQRIRSRLSVQTVNNLELSISFGSATKNVQEKNIQDILKEAEDKMYQHKLYESSSSRSKTIDLISKTLFEKNERELIHSKNVSELSTQLSIKLGFDDDRIKAITLMGLMHDIGKIGIGENILNKKGALSNDEYLEIKKHPEIGYRILGSIQEFSDIATSVLQHHERWDGSGYPLGLKGNQITIEARIIALADTYDAITSIRTYRHQRSKDEAIKEIMQCAGTQFDPELANAFVEMLKEDSMTIKSSDTDS